MKIKILGSGQEVGRSAILVEEKGRVVLDYGVKIEPEPPKYPLEEKADAAIISHAHLDHVGGAPVLFRKKKIPIYMNDITLELGMLLVRDSMKVAKKEGFPLPFGKKDMQRIVRNAKLVKFGERFRAAGFQCMLHSSGHIPGSSSIEVRGSKRLLYTSDIQTVDSRLVSACRLPEKADTLIVESTYSYKNHTPRQEAEKEILRLVEEALANEGNVLFPVFAVGRAQEVLLILEEYAGKIALDGMAKTASEIMSDYGSYLKDANAFRRIISKTKFIRNHEERLKAAKRFPIIISSAGMLTGGPVITYLRNIRSDENSKVIFCGFLVDDSPGRELLQSKIYKSLEEEFHVKCGLHQIDLSAHTDRSGLFGIIESTRPEQVICVHGEAENCRKFAKELQEKGVAAFAPKNGEVIRI